MPKRQPSVTCASGRFYFVKRVPKRLTGLVVGKDGKPVSQVRYALHFDSLTEANAKARQAEAEIMAEWGSPGRGRAGEAHKHYPAGR